MRSGGAKSRIAAGVFAAVAMLSSPAMAANGTGGGSGSGSGGGGNGGGAGSDTGSQYADLNVVLRAESGTPLLRKFVIPATAETAETTEYCPQPVSYSPIPGVASPTTNPVDGQQVWLVPLMGELIGTQAFSESTSACDPQSQYAMFVTPTDLARLNLARTTNSVLAQKLSDVEAKLEVGGSIALESTGRISIDGTPIDAAPENAAIYQALMTTGTIPGLPSSLAGPPASIPGTPPGNGSSQFGAWQLAAMALGATADKKTPLSVDAVEYYNRIIGLPALYAAAASANPSWKVNFITSAYPGGSAPADAERFVDYSGFSYSRSQTFDGSVTWLDTSTLQWKVSKILDVVPWHDLSPESATGTLHGILAFAQMADDVRALCDFIPDNTFIPGFYMDVPGVDTYQSQVNAITNPAVDLGVLPANVFQTYPFQMTASLFNPFGSDQVPGRTIPDARLRVTVHGPAALEEGDVTATEVPAGGGTGGQALPFSSSGGDLSGWWGPTSGFPVQPGYHESSTFSVTVGSGAPTGDYRITLDLVSAADPSTVLASDTGSVYVQPDRATVLWGSPLPELATQDTYMAIPLQVYSPAAEGTAHLDLTVTGPAADSASVALTAGDVTIYADNGVDMAPMVLTPNGSGQLVGSWDVALGEENTPGYTTVVWYAAVAAGAPQGDYAFAVSLENGNRLEPLIVSVAAPESHGQKPPGAGGDTTAPVVTVTADGPLGSSASFTLSAEDESAVTYSCQLTVNGAAGPETACGDNVRLDSLEPGVYSLTVVGTDTAGNVSVPVTRTWTVPSTPSTPPTPPATGSSATITSASNTTFTQGRPSTFKVTAAGTPTPKLTVVGNLPRGVSFIDNGDGTATLAGVPSTGTEGVYAFTVVASSGASATEQTFHLTVTASSTAAQPGVEPEGYWLAGSDGGIFTFGPRIGFYGSTGGMALNRPIVGMAATPGGHGYWLVASDGGVFSFGDARFYGSTGNVALSKPIVGMAATSDGHGYWLVASDGGVFAFGDAGFYGSTAGLALHRPIVGISATPSGHGYWLAASDGGVFSFGDARFYGSTGSVSLARPIVGIASPDARGYWLVASDGGVFAFGDAPFYGSAGGMTLSEPVVGMAENPATGGYWLVASDGGVFSFNTPFYGSAGSLPLDRPIVGMASAA